MTLDPLTLALAAAAILFALLSLALFFAFRAQRARRRSLEREMRAHVAAKQELEVRSAAQSARLEALSRLEAENALYKEESAGLRDALEATRSALKAAEADFAARREELTKAEARLKEQFSAVAADVLGRNSAQFLSLVSERFEKHDEKAQGELDARRKAVEEMVRPIAEGLTKFESQIGEIEKDRIGNQNKLEEQLRFVTQNLLSHQKTTAQLVQALRNPKTRGMWGESKLRNLLEISGMAEYTDFIEQTALNTDERRQIPDIQIRMPGGRFLIVDAKAPIDAYLSAVEAEDETQRREQLGRHASQVRDHVKKLSAKQYWKALPESPPLVVMFLPTEAIYSAALDIDTDLLEDSFREGILISSPTILMAVLKAVAYGWQQEKLARSTREIGLAARTLYERLSTLGGHFDQLGKALKRATESYNDAIGSMERMVLPAARKFQSGGLIAGLTEPSLGAEITVEPRSLNASELTRSIDSEPRALSAPELIEDKSV